VEKMKALKYIANFDSSTAMSKANANYLKGKDFPGYGTMPMSFKPLADRINKLPQKVREKQYIWSGWGEGVSARQLGKIEAETIPAWITDNYPTKPYPAVAIGSSNGALTHLWAALGIPWLPQTHLIPVKRPHFHPDEPVEDFNWGRQNGPFLLANNTNLQLHHMHDPNQDRLMIQKMAYYRVKWLNLTEAYQQFIIDTVPEGGIIFLVNCERKWKTTKVYDRYYFQFGALGGATPEEFLNGSERVEKYLEKYQSHRSKWEPPETDTESPEAEWGYETALTEDIEKLAKERNYQIIEVKFYEPEHTSPFVADFYQWWNTKRNIYDKRLFIDSFFLMDPWWTIKTGSIPFWMKFNMEPSYDWVNKYIEENGPFDEIYLTLFSHGVECVGLVPIAEWKKLLQKARTCGEFIGVDLEEFPRDFAAFLNYYKDFQEKVTSRYPMPEAATVQELKEFIVQNSSKYLISWNGLDF
jgi:hypothetical protein